MERTFTFSDGTRERAMKLFESDTEMLHEYTEGASERWCAHCGLNKRHRAFNEECPALLRCALNAVGERARKVEPVKSCGVCGCRMVEIRGRHPRDEDRTVCPTCCAERLDQINHISLREYGVAFTAQPLIRQAQPEEPNQLKAG